MVRGQFIYKTIIISSQGLLKSSESMFDKERTKASPWYFNAHSLIIFVLES